MIMDFCCFSFVVVGCLVGSWILLVETERIDRYAIRLRSHLQDCYWRIAPAHPRAATHSHVRTLVEWVSGLVRVAGGRTVICVFCVCLFFVLVSIL